MKRVLITGGEGFVGHNLAKALTDLGVDVITYDNGSSRRYESSKRQDYKIPPRGGWMRISGEIEDSVRLGKAISGCDTVFHLAANPDISKAASEPSLDFFQGTTLTQLVLEAARVAGCENFVFPSGSGVYGDCGERYLHEESQLHPVSPYGASKMGSEALICAYSEMFGIRGFVVRFANIVGPYQTHGVTLAFADKLRLNKKSLAVLGDGKQSKSYLHVSDAISAFLTILEKQNKVFETWNCATEEFITVNEIAAMAIEQAGLESIPLIHSGGPTGWKGDVPVIRFDTRKIRSIGWKNKWSSRDAIKDSLKCAF